MKNINWEEVQKFYDDNHTWRDIQKEFGLSALTIDRAKKNGKFKTRNMSEANKLSNIKFPRTHTEETKKKISESRKKYLKENPDKVPYLLNHYSKGESYPEKYFQSIFEKNDLNYKRYLQISIYNLDFAFVDKGIDLEVDGDQHVLDKKIVKSNNERDEFLSNNGWNVIRILWSDYQRMKKDEKIKYVNELIDYIKGSNNNLPKIIDNNHYCIDCGKKIWKGSKRCSVCSNKSIKRQYRFEVTKEELEELIKNNSFLAIGRMFGVSDNSIRKRARKYGLI